MSDFRKAQLAAKNQILMKQRKKEQKEQKMKKKKKRPCSKIIAKKLVEALDL